MDGCYFNFLHFDGRVCSWDEKRVYWMAFGWMNLQLGAFSEHMDG
jgi:hypothetical protein